MVSLSDPIGDLLTRMRNAQHAKHDTCTAEWSRLKEQLCQVLKSEGWIADVQVTGEAPKQCIEVTFHPEKERLTIARVSKPGRRVYSAVSDIKPVLNGFGIAVVSTSKGLMTDAQARKEKVGGEILCTIS